jgi:hypothetical protein
MLRGDVWLTRALAFYPTSQGAANHGVIDAAHAEKAKCPRMA